MGIGNEPESWEAVSGKQLPDSGYWDVAEISFACQEQVGGAALVGCFLVAFGAGAAWKEEPALSWLAPQSRLMYQITWEGQDDQDLSVTVGFSLL